MQHVLVALQIGKMIELQHFNFCNLTIWMSPLPWMPGAISPLVPPLCSPLRVWS